MKRKLFKNTITSLALQVTTVICGFILPRLILQSYGSNVNGLVNSISQFLQIIAFLDLGVGAVVQSTLYKPLAEHNEDEISQVIASASRFFKRIGLILLVYIVILCFIYPYISEQRFSPVYSGALIVGMGISSFFQYYFGVVDGLLLTADQRGYIQYASQIVTLVLNTVICALLIYLGFGIHIVKVATSLIYLARPVALRIYVNRHYSINRKITIIGEPIKQKWNGLAQHIAYVVLDGTDIIVLTTFSTLTSVSIYSVYYLVVYGVKQLFTSLTSGVQAMLGELFAKEDWEKLYSIFSWTEWLIHTGCVWVFGCTATLIVPFVQIYTNGVGDANYTQPLFAVLLVVAHAVHCLRLPYNILILASGHYKQTQNNYIIAAVMNLVLSILFVKMWGIIGVAIGTLVAMLYQTIWMAYYDSKKILKWSIMNFWKQVCTDILIIILGVFATNYFKLSEFSYMTWIIMAAKVSAIWALSALIINCVFYRDKMFRLFSRLKRKGQI